MKKYHVFDEYEEMVASFDSSEEATSLAEEICGYVSEEEEEENVPVIRSYEQMIMLYGTIDEKKWLFSQPGMEYVRETQLSRTYNNLSYEQKAEVDAGIESLDYFLSDSNLDYWRKAGQRAAMEEFL